MGIMFNFRAGIAINPDIGFIHHATIDVPFLSDDFPLGYTFSIALSLSLLKFVNPHFFLRWYIPNFLPTAILITYHMVFI